MRLRRQLHRRAGGRTPGGVAHPGVLVVDAGERSAIAACESLARAGYRVICASSDGPAPAARSRFASGAYATPNPRADGRRFAESLAAITAAEHCRTLLACSEGSLWAISRNRDAFADEVDLGLPPTEIVERATDKLALVESAADAGLVAPPTVVCEDAGVADAAVADLGLPLFVKPIRTVSDRAGSVEHLAGRLVDDLDALRARLLETGFPCLLQRPERGSVVSFGGVITPDGRLLAAAASRYLRTWPLSGGPVAFSESIDPVALAGPVTKLTAALGWSGIFELEAIEREDGGHAVLDFNPRIYGSLALAVRCGAPLPAIWCDHLLKRREEEVRYGRPGVFYRWEDADLRNSIGLLRSGRPREAISVLRPRSPVAHAYFRWYDPVPAAARASRLLPARLRRQRA